MPLGPAKTLMPFTQISSSLSSETTAVSIVTAGPPAETVVPAKTTSAGSTTKALDAIETVTNVVDCSAAAAAKKNKKCPRQWQRKRRAMGNDDPPSKVPVNKEARKRLVKDGNLSRVAYTCREGMGPYQGLVYSCFGVLVTAYDILV